MSLTMGKVIFIALLDRFKNIELVENLLEGSIFQRKFSQFPFTTHKFGDWARTKKFFKESSSKAQIPSLVGVMPTICNHYFFFSGYSINVWIFLRKRLRGTPTFFPKSDFPRISHNKLNELKELHLMLHNSDPQSELTFISRHTGGPTSIVSTINSAYDTSPKGILHITPPPPPPPLGEESQYQDPHI